MFRQTKTSSALGRVMGRGFTLTDISPEAFHCLNGDAHRFKLVRKEYPVVVQVNASEYAIGVSRQLEQECLKCRSKRPFVGSVPA